MSLSSTRNRVLFTSVLALIFGGPATLPSSGAEPGAPGNGAALKGDDNAVDDAGARRRRVNDNDWFRDPALRDDGNGGSVNGEFPTAEVGDFVVANARAATARMVFRKAESNLAGAVRDAKRRFEASNELKQALAAEREAHAAFEKARRQALAAVVANPRYQAIMTIRKDLGERIADRHAAQQSTGNPNVHPVIAGPAERGSELFTMAEFRMQVTGDARAMERAAIESSEDLIAARERLKAAARKVNDLRQEFNDALREDPDLLAARNALADARISKVAAAAYLRGSRIAAEHAVDFAYYLHRYDSQVAFDPYGGYDGYYYSSRYRYGGY